MNIYFGKKIAVALVLLLAFLLPLGSLFAQVDSTGQLDGRVNTVFTAIPFLRINPDGRTGAMGDVGIATDVDAAAIYHNASKLAFAPRTFALSATYTPWLKELVNDIYIAYLAGYYKIDDLQSMGLSIRFFSLGNIQFRDINGGETGQHNPNEFVADLAYARKLSDRFSSGITLKYVRSDLASGQEVGGSGNIVTPAQAVAADVSFFYKNPELSIGGREAELSLGAAVTNIGNKVSYTQENVKDFIPINLGLGSNLKMNIDDYNTIALAFDINKLLVPSPDPSIDPVSPDAPRNKPLLSGMFGSFADAPGGFGEEMQELMFSIGAEYWYNNMFAVRLGHFNEHRLKGNRKYLSVGLGLRYSSFGFNFSYIVPTSSQPSPLDNTLRFSLIFDAGESEKGAN